MAVQIVDRPLRTRCYICGDYRIEGLCHHCGRAMCKAHAPVVDNGRGFSFSAEFTGLNLRQTECSEAPFHCEYCDHAVLRPGYWVIVAGVVLILAGVFLLKDADRLLAVWAGVVCAALGVYARWQRSQIIQQSRPPLPVVPRFKQVKIHEALNGRVTLNSDGRYDIELKPVSGQLEITAIFSKRERERLDRYREKYQLDDDADVPFHTGFVVPRGPAGWKFADDRGIRNPSGFAIPLRGRVSELPFLSDIAGRGTREWPVEHTYSLLETPKDLTLPIRLVPSLYQGRARRVLELEVQWVAPARSISKWNLQQIKLLELHIPVLWGAVQDASKGVLIYEPLRTGDQPSSTRLIKWEDPLMEEDQSQEGYSIFSWGGSLSKENRQPSSRRTFWIQFEQEIDLSETIKGHVDVVFKNTLSGVEGIDLYYPVGRRRLRSEATGIQTTTAIDFELSLAGLRYQNVLMIPDSQCPQDGQPETRRFERTMPDHTTIIALTDAISRENFYVQHMIENRPQTMQQADMFNRYWDIAGRRYDGVYPIDFHLILTGEEIHNGGRARSGITEVSLMVQGAYTNDDMKEQVENVWEQLWTLIDGVMGRCGPPKGGVDERAVGG
jgi:hypothetical protein